MTVNRIFVGIYSLIILILIGLGVVTFLMLGNQTDLNTSQEIRFDSYLAADELRQSSDDLTRLARTYVVTGDSTYEDQYWHILDVRNGIKPRPDGRKIPLMDIMANLGFTDVEFGLLAESGANSDGLVWTETVAMNAVKGMFDDGSGNFTVVAEPNYEMAREIMFDAKYHSDKASIMEPIDEFFAQLDTRTMATVESFEATGSLLLAIIISLIVLTIIVALVSYFIIRVRILRQIGGEPTLIAEMAQQIADGDMDVKFTDTGKKDTGIYAAFKNMVTAMIVKTEVIESFAKGDFTVAVESNSNRDRLGQSLEQMSGSLNDILGQVRSAVTQVTSGSNQISQSSMALSQGASEQASSLEEVSSSLAEISSQSTQNAESATEANALAKTATENATTGNQQMQELLAAMERINGSQDEIKKVVKVIDDIAFQINLLALNANVEAARAGKYGKGFAVVADEVRNLAVRSANAVKETTQMVEDSTKNIDDGTQSAQATAAQLEEIVQGSSKVAEFLGEITVASREQAQGVQQIDSGLEQIDQVTQANTASAEESASASEELASQAQELQSMIAQFKLIEADNRYAAPSRAVQLVASGNGKAEKAEKPSDVINLDGDNFGEF
jgi:methyl-accepting chemotaxis protein